MLALDEGFKIAKEHKMKGVNKGSPVTMTP
jgi:hypothetical protein